MAIPYLLIGSVDENGTPAAPRHGPLRRPAHHAARGRAKAVDTQAARGDSSKTAASCPSTACSSPPARRRHPPIPGIEGPAVHPCWTLADARAIQALAKPGARVVQMGAGFIGCIILEALASRGVKLTVVEMGDRMVPRMMGPVAGTMIKQWCESKGITVFTGTRVDAIERDDSPVLKVRLSTGQVLEAELVISATGVRPNIGFLKDSGILCLQGVLTDEHLQTNVPGIYAAGDCAEAFDKITGRTIVSAIQPNASDQARVAALNMVGKRTELPGVTQINVLDTLGLISASFGKWDGVPAASMWNSPTRLRAGT
jgi:NADPH-dependent 2,4-dienoyl-CoA reductase/sulfur reductase-like enzyme